MDSRFQITWGVRKGGYRWAEEDEINQKGLIGLLGEVQPVSAPCLVPVIDVDEERYNPLSHPTLFGEFADVPPSRDEILAFANRYGFLRASLFGESLKDWSSQIRLLAQTVLMWEWWRERDVNTLSRSIEWQDGKLVLRDIYGGGRLFGEPTAPNTFPEPEDRIVFFTPDEYSAAYSNWIRNPSGPTPTLGLRGSFAGEDVLGACLRLISLQISAQLDDQIETAFNNSDGIIFRPKSLLGAMWLQFAEAVAGRQEYKRCEKCKRWMLKFNAKGKERKFCSNACKQAVKNKRFRAKQI